MRARRGLLRRLLTPTLCDCLLISLLVWQFAAGGRWISLLADGDVGWHIRTGEYILEHRQWPRQDLFSFSKPGEPWYAWEWLADLFFALVHRWAGLSGVAAVAALVILAAAAVLFQRMWILGANPLPALIALLLTLGASAIHFLARPHIFTLLGWCFFLLLLERDRRTGGRAIWWLVPMTVLWTNLHGGFTALLASLGLIAVGQAAEGWLAGAGAEGRWKPARRSLALLGACTAASLINPYGWHLHVHIAQYLRSDWIRNAVEEFQAPRFRSENALHFELLLLAALMLVPALVGRRRLAEALLVIFWAHAALTSARHIPLFTFLVAPWVAVGGTQLWRRWAGSLSANSPAAILHQVAEDVRAAFGSVSLWLPVGLAVVMAAVPSAHWPRDFPEQKFPLGIVERHGRRLAGSRVFTTDQWADYLIYRFYPAHRVYIDGRSDFYGPGIGQEYLRTLQGRSGWSDTLEKWEFSYVLAPPEWPLAELLEGRAGWRRLDADSVAVLYERAAQPRGR